MTLQALKAFDLLEKQGIEARLINLPTLQPIDEDLIISSAGKTMAAVTAEEHSIIGGLGSAVAELLGEKCPVPVRKIGIKDRFETSGDAEQLLSHYGLTADAIAAAAVEVIRMKNRRRAARASRL